jgi:2-hydroxycyclohexanecarboxyl-CoA dehydrogenase
MTVESNARLALVTGAASGMGEAIARRLDSAGMSVVVADIQNEAGEAVAASLDNGYYVEMDLADGDSVNSAAETVKAQAGSVDVLVNCAGFDVVKPFLDTDEDLWDSLIAVNLYGPLRTTKAFLPDMVERGWGRVVNISSDAGRVGSSGEAVYSACKGGQIAFTKTMAREMARHGITVNCVCPGPTDTPPVRRTMEEGGEKFMAALIRAIPLKRLGQPEDIAAAVAYLVSEDAGFVTGQTLSVSGGMSMC